MKKIFFILICFLASTSLFSAEISKEDFQKAKDFFIGKTLYKDPRSNQARVYYESGVRSIVSSTKPYKITKVKKNKKTSVYPFSLYVTENENKKHKQFIYAQKIDEAPYGFVFDINEKNPKKYFLSRNKDELEKTESIILHNKLLENDWLEASFDILKFVNKQGKESLSFFIQYEAPNWLFADKAFIYADDLKITLQINDTDRRINFGDINEYISGPINEKDILKIINSEKVTLRIIGDNGQKDFKFWPQNIYNLQRFYDEEIK